MTRGLETAEFPGRAPADPGPVELAHTFTHPEEKERSVETMSESMKGAIALSIGIVAVITIMAMRSHKDTQHIPGCVTISTLVLLAFAAFSVLAVWQIP